MPSCTYGTDIYGTPSPAAAAKPARQWPARLGKFIEVSAQLATALAIVFAWLQMRADAEEEIAHREREADQRRFAIYNEINAQYIDILKLCIQHAWVDCYDDALPPDEVREPRSAKEIRVEGATFAALISLLERAYVFYQRVLPATDSMVVDQWGGWEDYAKSFAGRARFRFHWKRLGGEFDKRFQEWMDKLIGTPRN